VLGADRIQERLVVFFQRRRRLVVLREVEDEHGRVNLGHRARHFRLAQAVARKAQVHEIQVQHAP
jgi:hypothetical protein